MTYGPVTPDQFRLDYPEFGNVDAYSASSVQYWFNVASLMLSPARWPTATTGASPGTGPSMMDIGTELFVAHNLVLERQTALAAQLTAQDGLPGPPGVAGGIVSSTGVGPVSVSYDTNGALDTGSGHWNLTIYGQRFARLARFAGKGGLQINTPGCWPVGTAVGWWG